MTGERVTDPVMLLASRVGPEEKRLCEAMSARGVTPEVVDTAALWGFAHAPGGAVPRPGLVLNREIGLTRARYAARLLESCGARVVNSAAAIETCGDKFLATLALRAAGLPLPVTALAVTPGAALAAIETVGYPAVVKPLVGSWGRLVTRVPDAETAETVMDHLAALPSPQSHIVYVQEFVDKPGRDIRVLVGGSTVIAAAYRYSADWRTNVARGAHTRRCHPTPELERLALDAARAVGAQLAGVDLIEDQDGRLRVLEVNHRVEFVGLQRAVGEELDIAAEIVEHVVLGSPSRVLAEVS